MYNVTSIIFPLNFPHSIPLCSSPLLLSERMLSSSLLNRKINIFFLSILQLLFLASPTVLFFPRSRSFLFCLPLIPLLSSPFSEAFMYARWTFSAMQCSSVSKCSCKDISLNKQEDGLQYLCPSPNHSHSCHLISCSHYPPSYHLFFLTLFSWPFFSPSCLYSIISSLLSLLASSSAGSIQTASSH